jgi:NADH:ubiquinone oxidoreductase subunit 3 (subunit A)
MIKNTHYTIITQIILVLTVSIFIAFLNFLIGPKNNKRRIDKDQPYECGIFPSQKNKNFYSNYSCNKICKISILFVIFEIESIFIIFLASSYRELLSYFSIDYLLIIYLFLIITFIILLYENIRNNK